MKNEENQIGLTELDGQDPQTKIDDINQSTQANHENSLDKDLLDGDSKNQKPPKFRFGLLAILFTSSLLILMRSLVDSSIGKPTPYIFPEYVDFSKVQIKKSAPSPGCRDSSRPSPSRPP